MTSRKTNARLYWLATVLLCAGMLAGAIGQLSKADFNVQGVTHLGYPHYLLNVIGIWKILGVIALLMPGYLLLKEWTYAGFFFLLSGATISHIVSGDPFGEYIAPLLFCGLTVASWYWRPAARRLSGGVDHRD